MKKHSKNTVPSTCWRWVSDAIWTDRKLPHTATKVYCSLVRSANIGWAKNRAYKDRAYVGVREISKETGIAISTVRDCLKALDTRRYIRSEWEGRGHRAFHQMLMFREREEL